MFEIIKSNTYKKDKKNLVFIDCKHRINMKNFHLIRYFLNIGKVLSDDFNIFLFNISNNKKACNDIMNLYDEFNYVFINDKDIIFDTLKNDKNAYSNNEKRLNKILNNEINYFDNLAGIFISPSVLFDVDTNNEKFDSLKENDIKAINDKNKNIQLIKDKKMWKYTTFMTKTTRITIDLIEYLINKYKCKSYQFIIDPAQFYHFLNKEFNSITYNFEDDFRGTRELHQFPMGQLTYIYNYQINETKKFEDKPYNFIWGGNALLPKGQRMQDWLTFFDKFCYNNSILNVSNTNGINEKRKPTKKLLQHPLYKKVFTSINKNKLNKGFIKNSEFERQLNDYKYTFILKCISNNDSLNFRIYYSLIYNMLPLIDSNYDIANIQIKKEFKDKLSVSNCQELIEKIDYFENNKTEAINLLKEMQEYYIDNRYKDKEFLKNLFKTQYFKEIYKEEK